MTELLKNQELRIIPDWFRVWGIIATSISSQKDKRSLRGEIDRWCQFIGAEKGTEQGAKAIISATSLTVRAYRNMLEQMPGAKSRDGDAERSAKAAPATVHKRMGLLRGIYRDLGEEGLVGHNPFLKRLIPEVTYQKRATEMLPFSKVWDVINAPGSPAHLSEHNYAPNCAKIIRDRAMLAVMFAGALRRSELADLRVGAVRMTERGSTYLQLRDTKYHGDAIQVIANWASEYLWAWHAARIEAGAAIQDYLFCPVWRDRPKHLPGGISDNGIYRLVKEYFRHAKVDPEMYSPHSARATSVTRLLDQGVSHRDVQPFSRHAQVTMVEHYDKRRVDIEDNAGLRLDFPRRSATND